MEYYLYINFVTGVDSIPIPILIKAIPLQFQVRYQIPRAIQFKFRRSAIPLNSIYHIYIDAVLHHVIVIMAYIFKLN